MDTNTQTPNPQSMSVETLAHIPESIKNNGVPVGRSYMNDGIKMGETIIAAEQAAVIAAESTFSTRLDGLRKIADISDDVGRNQFIGGVENAFIAVSPGGKKSKTHQNYLTECRRVAGYLLDMTTKESKTFEEAKKQVDSWLSAHEPGQPNVQKKYPAKLAQFPTRSNAGGNTHTTTTTEATTTNGAAALASAPATDGKGTVGAVTASFNQKELVEALHNAHENDLEAAFIALANRLKKSNSDLYRSWGLAMLDFDGIGGQVQQNEQEDQPLAANG